MTGKLVTKQTDYRTAYSAVLVTKYYCNLSTEQITVPSKPAKFAHPHQLVVYKSSEQWCPFSSFLQNTTQVYDGFNVNGKYTY